MLCVRTAFACLRTILLLATLCSSFLRLFGSTGVEQERYGYVDCFVVSIPPCHVTVLSLGAEVGALNHVVSYNVMSYAIPYHAI